MNDPRANLKGAKFDRPKGPASLILEPMRDWIWNTLNCFWNPEIQIKSRASDGTSTLITKADIVMGPSGYVATIDLTDTVPPAVGAGGQIAYVRACLLDGTTCYVPIYVQGKIYRNPGTGTTEATIDSGSVPTGATVII